MKQLGLNLGEATLLFAALVFTLPYIPSHEMDRLPLFPAGVFAIAFFGGSRLLRWRRHRFVAVAEILAFAVFVWGSNAVANLLYNL